MSNLVHEPNRSLGTDDEQRLTILHELERKVLWLSTWMIHHANHLRLKQDGLKIGGHQHRPLPSSRS